MKKIILNIFDKLLSGKSRRRLENFIFVFAVTGFLIHLFVIALVQLGYIGLSGGVKGLQSPIDALYTPFSIILFYEVYCLVYYFPKSMTIYIGKQFEIITLITIRDMFDEISNLSLSSDLHTNRNPEFVYSIVTILVLFFLIFIFYKQNQKAIRINNNTAGVLIKLPEKKKKYLFGKQLLALIVGIAFILLVIVNFYDWIVNNHSIINFLQNTKPVSKEFFSSFFTLLILSDVMVLLFSFAITDNFPKVMRNSAFVVSTTLIKLSFNVIGLSSHVLVVMAVLFGTLIAVIYKRYKTIEVPID